MLRILVHEKKEKVCGNKNQQNYNLLSLIIAMTRILLIITLTNVSYVFLNYYFTQSSSAQILLLAISAGFSLGSLIKILFAPWQFVLV